LTIRRATTADLTAVWNYRRLPAAVEWMTRGYPDRAAFDEHFGAAESLAKTLVVERDGQLIGDLMLQLEDGWAQGEVSAAAVGVQAELGWCLNPQQQGLGYAGEAVRELIRFCFDDLRLRRVVAYCFADNRPSWQLMEKVGLRREMHTVRDSLHRDKGWLDGYGYALLADEWAARH
jgi:RimJ/RimL family protein N-acetyltransferase